MPLPSSGQISVSEINTELDRASNTANSNFAGGTTPQSGSLFKLGEAGGINQTAPHKMSEWYGYSGSVRLVYQSSITKGSGYPTYSSNTNTWSRTSNTAEGTSCTDAIALSATVSNISSVRWTNAMIFSIEDENGEIYTSGFDLYFYRSVGSNSNIVVHFTTAWLDASDGGIREGNETGTLIAGQNQNISGAKSVSINPSTAIRPRTHLIFEAYGYSSQTNSANISIFDINTKEVCPV